MSLQVRGTPAKALAAIAPKSSIAYVSDFVRQNPSSLMRGVTGAPPLLDQRLILAATIARQTTYSSVRYGTYGAIRDHMGGQFSGPKKLAAGIMAGGIGAVFGCPADVALVRMQADGGPQCTRPL